MNYSFKLNSLESRKAQYIEEYEVCSEQLGLTIDPIHRTRLERTLNALEEKIKDIDSQIHLLKEESIDAHAVEKSTNSIEKLLFANLSQHFNLADLESLSFHLSIDFENLKGSTKQEKILALLQYCKHNNLIEALQEQGAKLRPHAKWQVDDQ